MSVAWQGDGEMWLEKFGHSYCLSNEMSFSHSNTFGKGLPWLQEGVFASCYCCCAALFWCLNKQPWALTSYHMNSSLLFPPRRSFSRCQGLLNVYINRFDLCVNKRKWEKMNQRKSIIILSIISLEDRVGEGIEGINDMSSLPDAHVDRTLGNQISADIIHLHNLFQPLSFCWLTRCEHCLMK